MRFRQGCCRAHWAEAAGWFGPLPLGWRTSPAATDLARVRPAVCGVVQGARNNVGVLSDQRPGANRRGLVAMVKRAGEGLNQLEYPGRMATGSTGLPAETLAVNDYTKVINHCFGGRFAVLDHAQERFNIGRKQACLDQRVCERAL